MNFFQNFEKIKYELGDWSKFSVNILTSARLLDLFEDRSAKLYVDYIVKDGERPEHLADRVYGRSDYHWVILLSNQIVNPYFDWPFSTGDLEKQIDKQYSGAALFFECIHNSDPDNTVHNMHFNVKDTSTLLPLSKSQFVVGNTITQGSREATITEWDATLRKLVVDDPTVDFSFTTDEKIYSTNQEGTDFHVYAKRVVLDNREAPHHFVDDFNNLLDPYGLINTDQYSDNKIYSNKSRFLENSYTTYDTSTNDFALRRYVNGSFEDHVVTNRQHETNLNDKKRNIKILRVEYLNTVVTQIESIFK